MKVAIHTVIKDELDEYLKPWLDYHSPMVDHIFIFEDLDSHSHKHITDQFDNVTLLSVLDIYDDEFGKKRLITNKERGGVNQRYYVPDGVVKIQKMNEYDWCFTIDIDEFITLQEPYKTIQEVLNEFQEYDAVIIQWMNFGANGRVYKPNYNGRDYREFYAKRGEFTDLDAKTKADSKICWNLNKITRWHLCGLHCCAGNWVKTNKEKNRRSTVYDRMYLKHYITRSFEEYIWKLYKRGMHTKDRHRKIDDFFQVNPDMADRKEELIEIMNKILKV